MKVPNNSSAGEGDDIEAMKLARIITDEKRVYIVTNLRDLAGGVKFDSAERHVRALNRPAFQTRVRFIPWKRIVHIDDLGAGA